MSRPPGLESLTPTQWRRLESLADDFERACGQATGEELDKIDLRTYLASADESFRLLALHELIKTHLEIRWRRNKPIRLEVYLEHYPELGTAGDLPPGLIYEEYRVRNMYGDRPSLAAYRSRFPTQFPGLEALVEKHPLPEPSPAATTPVNLHNTAGLDSGTLPRSAILPYVGEEYRLIEHLGEGTFGDVYRAESRGGVLVAVKRLRYPIDKAEAQSELKSLELIKNKRHTYLLATHAYWIHENRLHIAMELADGTLRSRLRQCQLLGEMGIPGPELVKYFHQAAEVIDYLHEEGILHRDIKPENILLLGKNIKVADLGLARLVESVSTSLTGAPGTPLYMGPELWKKKPVPSTKSDLYALAVTYGELRLGRRVFQGSTVQEIMFSHLDDLPDLLPLGEAERRVLSTAMAKDPAQRHRNCQAFIEELEDALWEDGAMKPRAGAPEPRKRLHKGSIIEGGYQLIELLDDDEWIANSNAGSAVNLCFLGELSPNQRVEAIKSLLVLSDIKHPNLLAPSGFWLRDQQGQVIRAELRQAAASPSRLTLVIASEMAYPNLLVKLRELPGREEGFVPARLILPYFRQAAAALDFLNFPQPDRPDAVMHCGIRPECLLVSEDDVVKVCDFRLARVLNASEGPAELPEKRLRSGYAAPELWRQRLTNRSDQFSLAVTYFQIRTGRSIDELCKPGEALSQIEWTGSEIPLNLQGLPAAEREVLTRALASDPQRRFVSSQEFIQALSNAAAVGGADTHPPIRDGQAVHETARAKSRETGVMPSPFKQGKPASIVPPPPPLPPPARRDEPIRPVPPPGPPPPAKAKPTYQGTLTDIDDLDQSRPWTELVDPMSAGTDPIVPRPSPAANRGADERQTAASPSALAGAPGIPAPTMPRVGLRPMGRGPRPLRVLAALGTILVLIVGVTFGVVYVLKNWPGGGTANPGTAPDSKPTAPEKPLDPLRAQAIDRLEKLIASRAYAKARMELDKDPQLLPADGEDYRRIEGMLHAAFEKELAELIKESKWIAAYKRWNNEADDVVSSAEREAMDARIDKRVRDQFEHHFHELLQGGLLSESKMSKAELMLDADGANLVSEGALTVEQLETMRFQLRWNGCVRSVNAVVEIFGPVKAKLLEALREALAAEPPEWKTAGSRLKLLTSHFPGDPDVETARQGVEQRIGNVLTRRRSELADAQKKVAEIVGEKEPVDQDRRIDGLCDRYLELDREAREIGELKLRESEVTEWRRTIFKAWLDFAKAFMSDHPDRADQVGQRLLQAVGFDTDQFKDIHAEAVALQQSAKNASARRNARKFIDDRMQRLNGQLGKRDWKAARATLIDLHDQFPKDSTERALVFADVRKWADADAVKAWQAAETDGEKFDAVEFVRFVRTLDGFDVKPGSTAIALGKARNSASEYRHALRILSALRDARKEDKPLDLADQKDEDAKAFLATVHAVMQKVRTAQEKELNEVKEKAAALAARLDDLRKVIDEFAAVIEPLQPPFSGGGDALYSLYRQNAEQLCRLKVEEPKVDANFARVLRDRCEFAITSVAEKDRAANHPLLVAALAECDLHDGKRANAEELVKLEFKAAPGYPRYLAARAFHQAGDPRSIGTFVAAFADQDDTVRWRQPYRVDAALKAFGEAALELLPKAGVRKQFFAKPADADAAFQKLKPAHDLNLTGTEASADALRDLRTCLAIAAGEKSKPEPGLTRQLVGALARSPGWAKLGEYEVVLRLVRGSAALSDAGSAADYAAAFDDFGEAAKLAGASAPADALRDAVFQPGLTAIKAYLGKAKDEKPNPAAAGNKAMAAFCSQGANKAADEKLRVEFLEHWATLANFAASIRSSWQKDLAEFKKWIEDWAGREGGGFEAAARYAEAIFDKAAARAKAINRHDSHVAVLELLAGICLMVRADDLKKDVANGAYQSSAHGQEAARLALKDFRERGKDYDLADKETTFLVLGLNYKLQNETIKAAIAAGFQGNRLSPLFDRSIEAAEQAVEYLENVELKKNEEIVTAAEYFGPLGKIFENQAKDNAFNAAQKGKLQKLAERIPKVVEKHTPKPVPSADTRAAGE